MPRNYVNFTNDDTFPVPSNISQLWLRTQGAGGAGKLGTAGASGKDGGGSGGGIAEYRADITSASWGNTITITIGHGSTGGDGGDTTVTVTLEGVPLTIIGTGGGRARQVAGNILVNPAGTGIGGTTNVSGIGGTVNTPEDPSTAGEAGWSVFQASGDPPPVAGLEDANSGFGGAGLSGSSGYDGFCQIEWVE